MHTPPFFDVVIPAYNRAATIGAALRSVDDQSYPHRRTIVVDDGSTDETVATVRIAAPQAHVICQTNRGAAAARNAGVHAATATWVAFLDSDDVWCPDHLSRMARAIQATSGSAHFYFADTIPDWNHGDRTLWEESGFRINADHQLAGCSADWAMLPLQPMMLQSAVFSRERYIEAGGLRTDLRSRHDTHLFLAMSLGQPICAVAGCGARMTAADITGQRITTMLGPRTRAYSFETVSLYEDIISRGFPFRRDQLRELRSRICAAHLQLAAHARQEGELRACIVHLCRAATRHGGRFLEGVIRRIKRRGAAPRPKVPG